VNGMVLKWGTRVSEGNSGSWVMRLTGYVLEKKKSLSSGGARSVSEIP
jgi:hypothetical protein